MTTIPAAPLPTSLRSRLARGDFLQSVTISIPSCEVAAQMAALGFDFLWIEMEHSPITLETLRSMVLATRGLPAVPIARVPVAEVWMAKRVLDAGSLGVIFPFVDTPALALGAARACRYPPLGSRGSGAGLASFRWPVPDYYSFADENVLCIAMIERKEALAQIDAIAATPGVDVIFIGVSDLSFSLGLRGELGGPEMQKAIDTIAAAARKHGRFLGRPALDVDSVARYRAEGFQFFQGPTDIDLMRQGVKGLLEPMGRHFQQPATHTILY